MSFPQAHLHTDECNEFAKTYFTCIEESGFIKWLGHCEDSYRMMKNCFKKERLLKAEANHIKARQRNEETRRRISEYYAKEKSKAA
ncbi:unnamed protein product [Bemisia tabaci]|uniref:COX assembly mitochondrial protein n=1 Tax=Bemisia tabaci TaxID=7038 RepID=A0A9P0AA39_BEMTA|nr:unnamed protein product [Bemisia tabaci]